MATAETTPAAAPNNATSERVRAALSRLSSQQKIIFAVTVAAIVSLLVWGVLVTKQPEYKTLFSNLGERDGGAIITALDQLNVPYKFSDGSGAIQVPSNRVHEVRLRLASQGLPKGGSVGFELLENQKFGISQFAEQVNYQRGLEGELARTIQSIGAVQTARVHLAIPKPSVFVRDEQKPTASVLLNLYAGRALEPAQVAGIAHLVASSVPQMPLSNVSIVDQNGKLLSELKSKLTEAGLDPTQLKYVQEIQEEIVKRIESIVTPLVGSKNVHVQVAADIDFSQSEQTAETYKPNGAPPNLSIRSQQNSETANVNQAGVLGVPGALSNQPPVPATAPLTAPSVPAAGAAGSKSTAGLQTEPGQLNAAGVSSQIPLLGQPPLSTRKDSTVNYEVDKTIRYTKQAMGMLKRVSAAVVVNQRVEVDAKTGKEVSKPLSEAEMKQINDLVKEAMGYSQERGDTLSVVNAAFTAQAKDPDLTIPLWKDPDVIDFSKDLLKYIIIFGGVAYLLLAVVKPMLRTMFPQQVEAAEQGWSSATSGLGVGGGSASGNTAGGLGGGNAGGVTIPGTAPNDAYDQKVAAARGVAQNDPKVVANIIKDWLGANG